MSKELWRLVIHSACDGATNMAIDEAILESVGAGDAPPMLRLYSWEPACLSLGYAQHASDADRPRLEANGWDLVRRPTGGRAILHTDELTYSIAMPESHPVVAGSIVESYRRLSSALMLALEHIGLEVNADKQLERAKANGPVCFEVPSHYEITAGSKKLIGSAQVRRYDAALQHGSLPLTGDLSRICEALVFNDEAAREQARQRVLRRATTLADALGREVSWEDAAHAIVDAFEETFDIALEQAELTDREMEQAHYWYETRYNSDEWTIRL